MGASARTTAQACTGTTTADLAPTVGGVLAGAAEDRAHARLMQALELSETAFVLHNDPSLIRSVVRHLQEVLRCLPLGDETEQLRVGVALEEALDNALYHGNLEVASTPAPDGRRGREERARRRLEAMPYAERRIFVRARVTREEAAFVVRDEGPGFDSARYFGAAVPDGDGVGGRGIVLIRTVMDEVRFNAVGNELTMVMRRFSPADPGAGAGNASVETP
jgi:anti-sigma regulatory factor (Ser/Thr protein kinase)